MTKNQFHPPSCHALKVHAKPGEVRRAVFSAENTDVEIAVPPASVGGGGSEQDHQRQFPHRLDRPRYRLNARHT